MVRCAMCGVAVEYTWPQVSLLSNAHVINLESLWERAWIRIAATDSSDSGVDDDVHRHVGNASHARDGVEGPEPSAVLGVYRPDQRILRPPETIDHESRGRVERQV